MTDQFGHFKMNHRLQAARLLSNYGCCHKPGDSTRSPMADQAIDFILNNLPEPSRTDTGPDSSEDTHFDQKLAQVIRESTDDGATVCRFLINVMDGHLSAFKPHHRIQAARELLSRGFDPRRSGEGRNPEEGSDSGTHKSLTNRPPLPAGEGWGESLPRTRSGGENHDHQPTPSDTPQPTTQPAESEKSPNPKNQSSDNNNPDEEEIPTTRSTP